MKKSHAKSKKHQARLRCERLARQIVIHGKRFAGDDDDFLGGIKGPAAMTQHDAMRVHEWMMNTPQSWKIKAIAYCRDDDGGSYRHEVAASIPQKCLSSELTQTRMQLLSQAINDVNHRHLVAEGFELRIA